MSVLTNIGVQHKWPPKLTLVIGNKNYSSWSLRPWLAMTASGVSFAEVLIPLDFPNSRQQALQYSPTGLLPAMKYGNLIVWETLAIIEFVHDKHPESKLWPQAVEVRALARALASEVHSGYHSLQAHCPMNLRRRAVRRLTPEVEEDVARLVAHWRRFRGEFGGEGDFIFGDFGAVDAMFAPLAACIRSYDIPVDRKAADYVDAILTLPAYQTWYQAAVAEPWRIPATDNIDNSRAAGR